MAKRKVEVMEYLRSPVLFWGVVLSTGMIYRVTRQIRSLILAATVAMILSAAAPLRAETPDQVEGVELMTLRIDGFACAYCAWGLEKGIERRYDPASYEPEINEGLVNFIWDPERPLNARELEELDQIVEKALFTLQEIRTAISGRVIREQVITEEERYFLMTGEPAEQRFYLYETEAQQEGLESELTESVRKRLDEAMDAGRLVRVIGPVHHHQVDGEVAIDVDELEVLPMPEELDTPDEEGTQ